MTINNQNTINYVNHPAWQDGSDCYGDHPLETRVGDATEQVARLVDDLEYGWDDTNTKLDMAIEDYASPELLELIQRTRTEAMSALNKYLGVLLDTEHELAKLRYYNWRNDGDLTGYTSILDGDLTALKEYAE